MSRPSSTSTNSANTFPQQAGALLVPARQGDPLSPVKSTFSFEDSANSRLSNDRAPVNIDEDRLTRPLDHGAPGEKKALAPADQRQQNYGSRRRTQYYEEQFAYKTDASTARERVAKDAPIIAELRTNVIIKDEYTLVTDLSHQLSQRYRRPESAIMITVSHSACLLLGGSFEPTYFLTINALACEIRPATNKRNAAMIQNFMTDTIGVPPDRGIIKFDPIKEESLAFNGKTILGEIDELERQQEEEAGTLKRALTKSSKRSAVAKAKSSVQLSRNSSKAVGGRETPPLPSPRSPYDSGVAMDTPDSDLPKETFKGRSKSTKNLGEKFGSKTTPKNIPPPPPIPEDSPAPKIGKRKSFISIFKR